MSIERYLRIIEQRKEAAKKAVELSVVRVGYTAAYAIYVHERTELYHKVGQAKFLEQPMRTEAAEMARIVAVTMERTKDIKASHIEAAKHLVMVSLPLVPVATGFLKGSWSIEAVNGS